MNSYITGTNAPVVVAINDSDASRAALAWAADYARKTSTHLQAVHVLQYEFGVPMAWVSGAMSVPRTVSASAIDVVKRQMGTMFDEALPEPGWTFRFLGGQVGHSIVEHARDASLLVIGTGAHRGLERLLAGSVSHYCLTHAHTAIVAVPAPRPVATSAATNQGTIPEASGARS